MTVKDLIDILNTLEMEKEIEIVSVGPEDNVSTGIPELEIISESNFYKILVGG